MYPTHGPLGPIHRNSFNLHFIQLSFTNFAINAQLRTISYRSDALAKHTHTANYRLTNNAPSINGAKSNRDQPLAANRAVFGPSSERIVVNKISRAIALDLFNGEARSREYSKNLPSTQSYRCLLIIDSNEKRSFSLSLSLSLSRRVSLIAQLVCSFASGHVASRGERERKKTSVAADTHFLSPR